MPDSIEDLRPPDKEGAVARAWKSPITSDEHAAHIATWFVNGPFHPHWNWWVISSVDLINRPGIQDAVLDYPEAEYEILVLSLNPEDGVPDVDTNESGALSFLTPPDLKFQCHGVSREVVAEVVEQMVDKIVAGQMSPDSDFARHWTGRLETTITHYKEGRHG
jgi:hypothetical protein